MKDNSKEINQMCKKLSIICKPDGYLTNDGIITQLGMLGVMPIKYILPTEQKLLEVLQQDRPNDKNIPKLTTIVNRNKPLMDKYPDNYIFVSYPECNKHIQPTALNLLYNYVDYENTRFLSLQTYYDTIVRSLKETHSNSSILEIVQNKRRIRLTMINKRLEKASSLEDCSFTNF